MFYPSVLKIQIMFAALRPASLLAALAWLPRGLAARCGAPPRMRGSPCPALGSLVLPLGTPAGWMRAVFVVASSLHRWGCRVAALFPHQWGRSLRLLCPYILFSLRWTWFCFLRQVIVPSDCGGGITPNQISPKGALPRTVPYPRMSLAAESLRVMVRNERLAAEADALGLPFASHI